MPNTSGVSNVQSRRVPVQTPVKIHQWSKRPFDVSGRADGRFNVWQFMAGPTHDDEPGDILRWVIVGIFSTRQNAQAFVNEKLTALRTAA